MERNLLACPSCGRSLPESVINGAETARCPSCKTEGILCVFPSVLPRTEVSNAGENALEETEARCFYHGEKRAAVACDACGVLICPLCDIPAREGHYCPRCLNTMLQEGRFPEFQAAFPRPDLLAAALACIPLMLAIVIVAIVVPVSVSQWAMSGGSGTPKTVLMPLFMVMGFAVLAALFSGPISLFFAWRYRKRTQTPLGPNRRFIRLALVLGSFESLGIIGWVAVTISAFFFAVMR
jgi:hypothetical protein